MPAERENCIGAFVRRKYPDLKYDNFEAYNNLVSKLRSRAKAHGFDPSNLTQVQFDEINSDSLEPLEKGERIVSKWENSSMAKAMIEDGKRYIKDIDEYFNKVIVNGTPSEDGDTIINYLYVPSTVKYLARSIKWVLIYLEKASMLDSESIEMLKKKLEEESTKADVNIIEDCPPIL